LARGAGVRPLWLVEHPNYTLWGPSTVVMRPLKIKLWNEFGACKSLSSLARVLTARLEA